MPSVTSLYRPKGSVSLPKGWGSATTHLNRVLMLLLQQRPDRGTWGAYTDGEPPRMDETTKALQAIAKAVAPKMRPRAMIKGSWHLLGR